MNLLLILLVLQVAVIAFSLCHGRGEDKAFAEDKLGYRS